MKKKKKKNSIQFNLNGLSGTVFFQSDGTIIMRRRRDISYHHFSDFFFAAIEAVYPTQSPESKFIDRNCEISECAGRHEASDRAARPYLKTVKPLSGSPSFCCSHRCSWPDRRQLERLSIVVADDHARPNAQFGCEVHDGCRPQFVSHRLVWPSLLSCKTTQSHIVLGSHGHEQSERDLHIFGQGPSTIRKQTKQEAHKWGNISPSILFRMVIVSFINLSVRWVLR